MCWLHPSPWVPLSGEITGRFVERERGMMRIKKFSTTTLLLDRYLDRRWALVSGFFVSSESIANFKFLLDSNDLEKRKIVDACCKTIYNLLLKK